MKKKRLRQSTCFMMGLIGAVLSAVAGGLMALGLGAAAYPRAAAFVMTGAMLLFLALAMQGDENRGRRAKLLVLFFALLVSYFDLPLLCPALEMLVLPLLCVMLRQPGDGLRILVLCLCELAYAVLRTLLLTPLLGTRGLLVVGLALVAVAAARFWALFVLHRRALAAEAAGGADIPTL